MLSLYNYTLCAAVPLMLFFGLYFLFAGSPDKAIFRNYLRSRRIMGVALLLLAANYAVHFLSGVRFRNVNEAIMMNLSTYFLCYWLFSSALTSLLDRFYITRRRTVTHICLWLAFTILSAVVLFLLPEGRVQRLGLAAMALWLIGYGLFLSFRLLKVYYRAVRIFNDTHSDDIGTYIRWLSVFTWWALIFGIGCGLLTFLPDEWVFVWIISSVPFYIYLFCCYMNYMLFYEQVETAMESEVAAEDEIQGSPAQVPEERATPAWHDGMAEKIMKWTAEDGYVRPGITIKDLSDLLYTNRTYLSGYIKTVYGMTFRDWIADLRIGYAKRRMTSHPEQTIAEISSASGFLSLSHFIKTFKEKEGCSPARWKRAAAENGLIP